MVIFAGRWPYCHFRAGALGVLFFTTAVLQSYGFRAGAPGVRFLYYGCTTTARLSSRSSGSTFPLLRLCYKVATFEPELREHGSPQTNRGPVLLKAVFPGGTYLVLGEGAGGSALGGRDYWHYVFYGSNMHQGLHVGKYLSSHKSSIRFWPFCALLAHQFCVARPPEFALLAVV